MTRMVCFRWLGCARWSTSAIVTAAIIRSDHGEIVAMTAIETQTFPHRLGGVRFVERGSVDEVQHLAAGMAEKCAASRVPLGGQKTLIVCPRGVPELAATRAEILSEHIHRVLAEDGGGIFGPDMACGTEVLDLLATEPVVRDHITGLSERCFGLDINRNGFTAHGVVHAFDCFSRLRGTTLRSATVQGFGMVGAPIARDLTERGIAVRAVSNRTGALINAEGLDVVRLFALWRETGDDCLTAYAGDVQCDATFEPDPDALFDVHADIFVPAARTTVLALASELAACRPENGCVRSVEQFALGTGCKLVLEAANHPLTTAAEEFLERRGVAILPDVLVNIGGMVGCYAEWRNRRGRASSVSLAELSDRCHRFTQRSVEENVRALLTGDSSSRCAATSIVRMNRAAMLSESSADVDLFARWTRLGSLLD
jgi:glutamate dehydrogenase/leucine dehydrogenase